VEAGTVLGGRVEIVRPVGAGAMGEVFEGVDRRTGRHVAVKIIHEKPGLDLADLQRFLVEARAAAAVAHAGIVRTFDVDVTADGTVFQVMELLEGSTMSAWIALPGARPIGAVAAVGHVLAEALAAAHEAGVVHRDVKPGNVMLTVDGGVKVLDFGLSKIADAGGNDLAVTQSHALLGTPAYMAPEQFAHARSVGPAADVYSLGAVLYEALTGVLPYGGATTGAILLAHAQGTPVDVAVRRASIPRDVARTVMACLSRDHAARPRAAYVARLLALHARPEELRADLAAGGVRHFDPDAPTLSRD
jgi:serine/threonine protein kinase